MTMKFTEEEQINSAKVSFYCGDIPIALLEKGSVVAGGLGISRDGECYSQNTRISPLLFFLLIPEPTRLRKCLLLIVTFHHEKSLFC